MEALLLKQMPFVLRCAIGLAAVAAGLTIRLLFAPWLGPHIPFLTLYPAVMIAALFGGPAGGVMATLASLAYAGWLLSARGDFPPLHLDTRAVGMALFVAGCALLVWVGHIVRNALRRQQETGARLSAALSASRVGTWRWDVQRDDVEWDESLSRLYGIDPAASPRRAEEFFALLHPEDLPRVKSFVSDALPRLDVIEHEFRALRPDGGIVWIYDRGRIERDGAGRPTAIVGACLDITQRKSAEEANAHLAAVATGSQDAIVSFDQEGRVRSWNDGAQRMFGLSRAQAIGLRVGDAAALPQGLAAAVDRALAGEASAFTAAAQSPAGRIETSVTATPMRDADGAVIGVSSIIRDDSERHAAMEKQILLVRELHHRVRNTLGMVQALISTTARSATSPAELRDSLAERVRSLARAHELITRGDAQQASVRELLWAELKPFADPEGRILIDGPSHDLYASEALNLALAVHELATNAAKYGALSAPAGRLEARWSVSEDANFLTLDWRERGGPAPGAPMRSGFGMTLLRRLFPGPEDLRLDFTPDGLTCHVRMRLFGRPVSPLGDIAASARAAYG